MPRTSNRGRKAKPATFDTVRQFALALPGVQEGMSYGTPAFRVKGKFLGRMREDGDSFVIKIDFDEREFLMKADSETFYITDHYLGYPAMLIRLSKVHSEELRRLIEQAWRRLAPKKLAASAMAKTNADSMRLKKKKERL